MLDTYNRVADSAKQALLASLIDKEQALAQADAGTVPATTMPPVDLTAPAAPDAVVPGETVEEKAERVRGGPPGGVEPSVKPSLYPKVKEKAVKPKVKVKVSRAGLNGSAEGHGAIQSLLDGAFNESEV